MKRIFILLGMLFFINTVFSQNIIKAEYFLDTDPGPGNGIVVPAFAQGGIVNFPISIATSNLSNGFHFLNTRVADANGVWSMYETRIFYISDTIKINTTNIAGAEYFIDSVPATGGGTPINIGSPGSLVNFVVQIPATLSSGFHFLSIRVKDQEAKWSLYEQRFFYIPDNPVSASPIVAAEYFFDTDPGIGIASPLIVNPSGDIITQTFLIPVPTSLSQGDHILAIRVKDQQGHWGFYAKDTISVSNGATISCPSNTTVAASAGQCTAIVNGIDPTILPAGTSYTYTLSGATTGTGAGTASGKTFNSGVTTVTYALTNSPATNCSFTVTVNSSITASVSINASATTICSGQQVTFTAVPVNGGSTPVYQWKKNGSNIAGAMNSTYQSSSLANGDVISVAMNSSLTCASPSTVASNNIPVTVNPSITSSVTINASATSICLGHLVTFTSVPVNGGNSPAYQWKKNGNNIAGATNSGYQSSSLTNGDIISLAMTSSLGCANPSTVASNNIPITVNPVVTPSVSITASTTSICPGQTVTFTATPINGGAQPLFQWVKNGVMTDQGTTYQTSALSNGDSVYVILYNTTDCIPNTNIISNVIYVTVAQTAAPSVSISQSPTIICSGSVVTFTANPVNGGSTPAYQWKLNDINVGNNSNTYTPPAPVNGNVVKVIMTSSLGCASPPSATSNSITMMVDDSVQEYVSITASATTICAGTLVTFAAAESGGGSGTFQWKLNGNNVGTNSLIYRTDSLHNGDKIKVVFATTFPCSPPLVSSNEITITVNPAVTPSVSILPSATTICQGQQVTFTATPVNGGATPFYQWKLNGNNVGSNSPTYQNAALQNSDSIRVVMTSSLGSVCQPTASSNRITMSVGQTIVPSVSILASTNNICPGQQVTFTASPVNSGATPSYQWKLNGVNIPGATGTTYQTSSLSNGDQVKFAMVSSLSCANPNDVVSNVITMNVGSGTPPSVTINASDTSFCYGTLVTFIATPTNGETPSYEWKVNGNNVGATSSQWQVDGLLNGDTVTCLMTSNACGSPQNVTSNRIIVTVQSPVAPSVHVIPDHNPICFSETARFTAYPTNGGDHPFYQWRLNGVNVGADSSVFSYDSARQGDWVQVFMTSSLGCVQGPTVESQNTQMYVDTIRTYYRDRDGDWYGNPDSTLRACRMDENSGWVIRGGDCNDNNSSIHPEATEICGNGIDDDCDGQTDEGCTQNRPALITRNYPVKEGDVGLTTLTVDVSLDTLATLPVSVKYKTINEDAIAGTDYESASGTLLIPAGKISASFQVRIIGDVLRESNERFRINFSDAVNVLLPADPNSRVMIIDDDKGKPNSVNSKEVTIEQIPLKIPTVTKRNQVWMIPQIGNYENEVLIMNVQGQIMYRFINYKNQISVGNLASGLYFYQVRITESNGQYKYYPGRLLITE